MGMPIAGTAPVSNVLQARERGPTMSEGEWAKGLYERNIHNVERTKKYQSHELAGQRWAKSLEEVAAGRITEPEPITEEILRRVPLTPRFAVRGPQSSKLAPKIRTIDDFRASAINDILHTSDTDVPENLDTLLAAAVFHTQKGPAVKLLTSPVDFKHAYKTIPICRTQGDFAHIVLTPPQGEPMVAELRTQPFGSRRAPANWGRVAAFAQWALSTFFCVYLAKYVDDCFATAPESTCSSAFLAVKGVCEILGFPLEEKKECLPAPTIDILGATVSIGSFFVEARLPTGRKGRLISDLKEIAPRGTLTPGKAAKIRGRLGYAQSLMFGRLGRAHLQPFSDRQYAKHGLGKWELNSDLKEVLAWWIANVFSAVPRRVNFSKEAPVLVYTDASGQGHVEAVLVLGGRRISYHTHMPAWAAKWGIFEFELAAVILGIVAALIHAPARAIFAFCDNTAVDHTVVRGSNSTRLGRSLCSVVWAILTCTSTALWLEYVNTMVNPADPPSRACWGLPEESRHMGVSCE